MGSRFRFTERMASRRRPLGGGRLQGATGTGHAASQVAGSGSFTRLGAEKDQDPPQRHHRSRHAEPAPPKASDTDDPPRAPHHVRGRHRRRQRPAPAHLAAPTQHRPPRPRSGDRPTRATAALRRRPSSRPHRGQAHPSPPQHGPHPGDLLTDKEAGAFLRIDPSTIRAYATTGYLPKGTDRHGLTWWPRHAVLARRDADDLRHQNPGQRPGNPGNRAPCPRHDPPIAEIADASPRSSALSSPAPSTPQKPATTPPASPSTPASASSSTRPATCCAIPGCPTS